MGAASRAFSAGRKPPKHAPKGTLEGGQFIGRASITHALIRKLLGVGEDHDKGSAVGRFTSRGGSVASIALHPRRPRIDDRVRDPRTGKLGRVLTINPELDTRYVRPGETQVRAGQLHPVSARVKWDDGQEETRPLSELEDPHAQRQLPDPERTFHAERGPRPAQVDTALTPAPPGKIATQWGMATEGPLAPSQRGYLHKFKEAAPRSAAIYDSDRADTEELRARGLITVNARNGSAKITNRGQRELSTPGSSDPGPHRRTAAERIRDGLAAGKVDNDTATRLMRGESPTSIVDSRTPAGFRDAQRARLSPADQAALDGLDANRRELYWLHRAAGEDHDKALAGVAGGAPGLTGEAGGRPAGPLTKRQLSMLTRADRAMNGKASVSDAADADARDLHERGLVKYNPSTGEVELTGRGQTRITRERSERKVLDDLVHAGGTTRFYADFHDEDTLASLQRQGLIERDGHILNLTEKGRAALATPSSAKKATAAQRMSRATPALDLEDVVGRVNQASVEEDVVAILAAEPGMTVTKLRKLAEQMNVRVPPRTTTKPALQRLIANETVGFRRRVDGDRMIRRPVTELVSGGTPSRAAAKMARGKAPSGPRPSGLPTDRKAVATDFEDLAHRVSLLRTAEQRHAVLADLNATELNALARQFPGDPFRTVSGTTSDRRTVLKIPAGLSIEERRRWLADKLSGREGDLPRAEGAVAKMARAKAPPVTMAAGKPDGPQVRRVWHGFNMGPGVAQQYGRASGDEALYLPNRGADQGLVHLDSQLGTLWQDLVADNREPNSFVNAAAHIGEDVGTGKISLDEAADRLRRLSAGATDQAVARRIDATIRGITESSPPPRIDVPDNVPPAVRRWLDDLARIPTMRKTDLPGNRREQSALDEALALVREISQQGLTGQRTMSAGDAEMRLLGITQNVHESIDGVYHARRLTGRTFNTENPDWPAIRDWLRGR